MNRLTIIGLSLVTFVLFASPADGQPLELGILESSAVLRDPAYEAFSTDDLHMARFAVDARVQVLNLSGFKVLPFIGYRVGGDFGLPYAMLDTELIMQDFLVGLRIRKGFLRWMGIFLEASGGASLAMMSASPVDDDMSYGPGMGDRNSYQQKQWTWSTGALVGLEFYISKSWMRSRGVKRFNFGGEIGGGYAFRGDFSLSPELEDKSKNAIPVHVTDWGDFNLSGWVIQAGVCFKFF